MGWSATSRHQICAEEVQAVVVQSTNMGKQPHSKARRPGEAGNLPTITDRMPVRCREGACPAVAS
eukprot:5555537-Pyramimonas_sp.AAC.1